MNINLPVILAFFSMYLLYLQPAAAVAPTPVSNPVPLIDVLKQKKWLTNSLGVGYGSNCCVSNTTAGNDTLIETSFTSGSIPTQLMRCTVLKTLELSNQLTGQIPSQIGYLVQITRLMLIDNTNLSGSIPTQLYMLTRLVTLGLTNSKLSGRIWSPLATLAGKYSMKYLDLSNNNLSGSIPSLDKPRLDRNLGGTLELAGNPKLCTDWNCSACAKEYETYCTINCDYSICSAPTNNGGWSAWTACTVTCGTGTQSRYCNNPVGNNYGGCGSPSHYGTQSCNTVPCPATSPTPPSSIDVCASPAGTITPTSSNDSSGIFVVVGIVLVLGLVAAVAIGILKQSKPTKEEIVAQARADIGGSLSVAGAISKSTAGKAGHRPSVHLRDRAASIKETIKSKMRAASIGRSTDIEKYNEKRKKSLARAAKQEQAAAAYDSEDERVDAELQANDAKINRSSSESE